MNDRRPYSLLQIRELGHELLLVVEGSLTVAWCEATRVPTELGEGDTALTSPPAVEVLRAGAEGATFLALVSRS